MVQECAVTFGTIYGTAPPGSTATTHASITDPDALLYRKVPGMEVQLCYIGHGLIQNHSGLIVDTRLTKVSSRAEWLAAPEMIEPWSERGRAITLGADKKYDARDFVMQLRELTVRPYLAHNQHDGPRGRRSAIDWRATRHAVTFAAITYNPVGLTRLLAEVLQ